MVQFLYVAKRLARILVCLIALAYLVIGLIKDAVSHRDVIAQLVSASPLTAAGLIFATGAAGYWLFFTE